MKWFRRKKSTRENADVVSAAGGATKSEIIEESKDVANNISDVATSSNLPPI